MSVWQPGARPKWVRGLNRLGDPKWVSLDGDVLVDEAIAATGLDDFGGASWREGFEVFVAALEREAQLHFVGRVLARGDIHNWLTNRLSMTEARRRNPAIDEIAIERPLFITGLPRTGTSILHELLGCDPASRAPLAWEVRHPVVAGTGATSIAEADDEIRLWNEIVPEYDTMHELGAEIPVECIQITAHEFRSDELSGRHVVPSYAAWLATADLTPAYAFHRRMLQVLASQRPAGRWVLKAPSHMSGLAALLAVYPDACIVQTHRDPLTVMASVASVLFATAWVRCDAVDAEQIVHWFDGATCKALLDSAEAVRARTPSASARFYDVRYDELVSDPLATIAGIYDHFGMALTAEAERRMREYVVAKPKGKHGAHRYEFSDTGFDVGEERRRFADYQQRYGVVSEVTA
jgi:hypothetical protein